MFVLMEDCPECGERSLDRIARGKWLCFQCPYHYPEDDAQFYNEDDEDEEDEEDEDYEDFLSDWSTACFDVDKHE